MAAQEAAVGAKREERQQTQKKTFTRWCNTHLVERNAPIADLIEDLKDGTPLINLLEIISSKSVGKYRKKNECKVKIHRMENLTKALDFIRFEGIKLVNIDGNDIEQGNLTCILGLIWTLILRYQIEKNRDDSKAASAKSDLLAWINARIAPKRANNFTTDWQDGDYLCRLVNSLRADSVKPTGDALTDTEAAITIAEQKFQIPRVLDAADLVKSPDELSTMTYLSYFRTAYEQLQVRKADPTKAYAEGPGLTSAFAHDKRGAKFTIHSFDASGHPWPASALVVTITGPDGKQAPFEIHDNKDGTYNVSYVPQSVGDFKINVLLEGKVIKDMPRTVKARAGADVRKSTSDLSLTIQSYLSNGDAKKEGGDRFECTLKRGNDVEPAPLETKDNGNGTYSVFFPLPNEGQYTKATTWTLTLSLNGHSLPGSPLVFSIPN